MPTLFERVKNVWNSVRAGEAEKRDSLETKKQDLFKQRGNYLTAAQVSKTVH